MEMEVLAAVKDPLLGRLLRRALEPHGVSLQVSRTGDRVLKHLAAHPPTLLLIDATKSSREHNGWTVCQDARRLSDVPIIVITAPGRSDDRVRALQLGAHDCLAMPLAGEELVARMNVLVSRARRTSTQRALNLYVDECLSLNFSTGKVRVGGHPLSLTATEFRLLAFLVRHAGQVMTHEQILENVWGHDGERGSAATLKQYVWRLRRQIDAETPEESWILTYRGFGYAYRPPEKSSRRTGGNPGHPMGGSGTSSPVVGALVAELAMPQPNLARTAYLTTKRLMDLVLAGLGLIIAAPVLLVLGYLIKRESSGPAIFQHLRVGEMGRTFVMYKLRTMGKDAPLHDYKPEDESDARLTPLGRVLRQLSLDELPQLVNILRGEMSLVGPRPEQPFIVEQYEPWQRARLLVKPGLTGWWQVNGRSDKPMHLHTKYDIYYVQNQSLWLDLKILLKTGPAVLRRTGAR